MPCIISMTAVIAVLFIILFTGYNRLQTLRNVVERTFSQVDTELQQRANLIPALVEVAKGYAKHERDTLEGIAEARAQASYSNRGSNRKGEEKTVAEDFKQIIALREAYPDLKANEDFLRVMNELEMVEEQIADQREAYNNVVKIYNDAVQTFPYSFVASVLGFAPIEFFDFEDEIRVVPRLGIEEPEIDDLISLSPEGDER